MPGMTDYMENLVLEAIFGATPTVAPNKYVALFTTAPDTETGAGGVEVSAPNYTRVYANDWTVAGSQASNASVLSWPLATQAWGTVVAVGIYDQASGGNLLYSANLDSGKVIAADDVFEFQIGALVMTQD